MQNSKVAIHQGDGTIPFLRGMKPKWRNRANWFLRIPATLIQGPLELVVWTKNQGKLIGPSFTPLQSVGNPGCSPLSTWVCHFLGTLAPPQLPTNGGVPLKPTNKGAEPQKTKLLLSRPQVDPLHVCVARHLLNLGRRAHLAEVCSGQARGRFMRDFGYVSRGTHKTHGFSFYFIVCVDFPF